MKLRPTILFVLFSCIITTSSLAQFRCGFDELHTRKMKSDAAFRQRITANEKFIQNYIAKNKRRLTARVQGTAAPLYIIPVVVHVVHTGGAIGTIYNPSDAQIQNAINYLNQVFNGSYPGIQGAGDIQIQFALAQRDPNCNPTSGINRIDGTSLGNYAANGLNYSNSSGASELSVKNLSRWNCFDYYNIWIVNKIDGNDGTSGSFIAGYAYFPGADPNLDGTVMLATQMTTGSKTLPHEIGHAFALHHPFYGASGATCPANTYCNTQGDFVCDTDPVTEPSGFVCRTGVNSCTGTAYNNNTEYNFMNYTSCYNLFTSGQKARMLAAAASIYRVSLTTSPALTSTNISFPYTAPGSASCTPVPGAGAYGGHYAGIMDIELNGRHFGSSSTLFDNGYVNGTNCIKLLELVRGNTYTITFNVLNANRHQLRAWVDYDNNGVFDNATEQIFFNTDFGNEVYTASASFTVPGTAVINTPLRMRVINDLIPPFAASIGNACHNPVYGQAEDYPIYITAPTLLASASTQLSGRILNNEIVLSWQTQNSAEVRNYEIEKSDDGIEFFRIGMVHVNSVQSYSFKDGKVNEVNFYRLRINEYNGRSYISNIILMKNEKEGQNITVANNPFSNNLTILCSRKAHTVKLQLINSSGSIVGKSEFSNPPQRINWNLHDGFPKGVYILRASVDGETFFKKVVKN